MAAEVAGNKKVNNEFEGVWKDIFAFCVGGAKFDLALAATAA